MSPPAQNARAAAGEHHHIRLGIVPGFDKDAGKLGVKLGIDGIERVRPVERQNEDAPAAFDGNGPIFLIAGHGALPRLSHRGSPHGLTAVAACARAVHVEPR
jgi:hypothetical protein